MAVPIEVCEARDPKGLYKKVGPPCHGQLGGQSGGQSGGTSACPRQAMQEPYQWVG